MTDRTVDDILHRVQSASQANKSRSNEIAVTVGEAFHNAQRGMDQAFIAGALATPAGVARKDSIEYSRQVPQKVKIEAAVKAKTYLKEAKKKVKILKEEEFEKLRLLVTPDEDTFVLASDLLKNIKTIAKQSIKLAGDVTKHPGSLGAVHKTQAVPKYPDLRECTSGTKRKHLKIAPKSDDITPSAPMEEDPADPNSKPPRYESIQQKMDSSQSYVHFPGGINHNLPPPTMA